MISSTHWLKTDPYSDKMTDPCIMCTMFSHVHWGESSPYTRSLRQTVKHRMVYVPREVLQVRRQVWRHRKLVFVKDDDDRRMARQCLRHHSIAHQQTLCTTNTHASFTTAVDLKSLSPYATEFQHADVT